MGVFCMFYDFYFIFSYFSSERNVKKVRRRKNICVLTGPKRQNAFIVDALFPHPNPMLIKSLLPNAEDDDKEFADTKKTLFLMVFSALIPPPPLVLTRATRLA